MALESLWPLVLETYGPIGLLAIMLWYRQGKIIGAIEHLAEEHEGVDEDKIIEGLQLRKGD